MKQNCLGHKYKWKVDPYDVSSATRLHHREECVLQTAQQSLFFMRADEEPTN